MSPGGSGRGSVAANFQMAIQMCDISSIFFYKNTRPHPQTPLAEGGGKHARAQME